MKYRYQTDSLYHIISKDNPKLRKIVDNYGW